MNYLQKKKLAFMSIVNQIKGFVRTVTGIPPLTLPDCVDEDSIINYTIDGNSIQDGTPTPENPVEVESVGEKTKNLIGVKPVSRTINGATFTVNENGSITLNGTTTSQALYHFNPSYNETLRSVSVTANKSYTLSRGVELPTGVYFMTYYRDSSGAYTYVNSPKTFTPTEDVDIAFYIRWDAGITMDNVTIYPQLEEGSTATDYEPYGKYKIPIICSDGKGKSVTTNIYLDEPLRKVGSYTDSIDFQNQKIIRKVGVEEFDENTAASNYKFESVGFYGFFRTIKTMKSGTRQYGFCTYLQNLRKESSPIWFGVGNQAVYFSLPDVYNLGSNNEERKQALRDWFASLEEPFMVYYPLAEETETPISLPKLPTFKGTTI